MLLYRANNITDTHLTLPLLARFLRPFSKAACLASRKSGNSDTASIAAEESRIEPNIKNRTRIGLKPPQ